MKLKQTTLVIALVAACSMGYAQDIYQYKQTDATVCFFSKNERQHIPQMMRKYKLAKSLHHQIWGDLPTQPPFIMVTDWEDDGNGGVSALPYTYINVCMAPLNMSQFVSPSTERYDHLFKHEYTHVVMADKANKQDRWWRKLNGNKIVRNSDYPLSAVWSYLDVPRWYAPRWFHEGIACFMETWLTNGTGRALGGYDETYFRTQIKENKDLFSVVGLETEGMTSDFQQGATAYLYGMRFVNYLVLKYGFQKLVSFYNRTDDSKTFFGSQFKKVYGLTLRQAWDDWREYEKQHQDENLQKIAQYPLTETKPVTQGSLGAMSPMCVDDSVAYAAINHIGDFAHIAEINLNNGEVKKLANIDSPMMYQTSYVALDKRNQRLIWTDRNSKWRGMVVYDLKTHKKVKHMKMQRLHDICYDNANDNLYGIMSNGGVCHLVKYDAALEKRTLVYSFTFGVSVGDLDISHDGKYLVCSLLGTEGQHSLIMFSTEALEEGNLDYTTLLTLDNSNLSQFRFSEDDTKLVGFSYYTGVPNLWSYDLKTKDFKLLSNVQTGLFAPYLYKDGRMLATEFSNQGMQPVSLTYKELNDANAVEFLGQKAYRANPEISNLSELKSTEQNISFSEVYDSVKLYKPLKELRFQGSYLDLSGFVDRQAWNNVTPVIGYHASFFDPLSLASLDVFVGASPWSNNAWKNKFHASASLKWWNWTLDAAWNPTCFYDLFGPRRSSRKGYNVQLQYNKSYSFQTPFAWSYGAAIAHYGDMDVLPLYQEVAIDEGITSFQTASAYIAAHKTRTSLGGITAEQGYSWNVQAYTYLAKGEFFPSANATFSCGTLLPFGIHNTGWLHATVGQSFGNSKSSLGNEYFGGFRNNYVDNGTVNRYITTYAMPGARIDDIAAHTFAKCTGDISFCPIRFNNFGNIQCYPNYVQFNVFASDLLTDQWGSERRYKANYVSVGAQMNMQLVLFTHMTTTLSVGYARIMSNELKRGEFMVSLKLL
ncbi:MAG: hypothetical protein Q4F34_01425 [Prevotellaceae bacterium]|nr:hypothetical protein [Prevotellaceae bacterium]